MPISTRPLPRSSSRKSASRAGGKTNSNPNTAPNPARFRAVWISFLGAMTLVGGLLLVLDGNPVPRTDGVSLSPLAVTGWSPVSSTDPVLATRRPLDHERWQAIVIHHSGSSLGTPASIEAEHQARNLKGLGHHFIIGNGRGMDDGQIHIGYRWLDQLPGAHAAGPNGEAYNLHAISICLVGDGNRREFTPAQLERLTSLVAGLRHQFNIPADHVVLHSDIAGVDDPGRLFPTQMLRTAVAAVK